VKKFLRAIKILRQGGELEVFDLEAEKVFFRAQIALDAQPERSSEFEVLIDDLVQISDRLGSCSSSRRTCWNRILIPCFF